MQKDVFISYHGGYATGERSSYSKALELKNYFENHENCQFQCFLCKKEHNDDFYDAINKAILEAKHFILIACDKEMLYNSEWIKEEVKQFDTLKKNGRKPNSVLNAYIYGNLTESDLAEFNTVFASKDIASGDDGFETLYQMVLEKSKLMSSSLSTAKHNFEGLVSFKLRGDTALQFVDQLKMIENEKYLYSSIHAFLAYVDSEIAKNVIQKYHQDGMLFLLSAIDAKTTAKYLAALHDQNINAVIYDKYDQGLYTVFEGELVDQPQTQVDFTIGKKLIHLKCGKYDETRNSEKTVLLSSDESGQSVIVQNYDPRNLDEINLRFWDSDFIKYAEKVTHEESIYEYYYYLYSVLQKRENSFDEDSLRKLNEKAELMELEVSDNNDMEKIEMVCTQNETDYLLSDEKLLTDYYHTIKSTRQLDFTLQISFNKPEYTEIANNIKDFYLHHNAQKLEAAINAMLDTIKRLNKQEFRSYRYLLVLLSEICVHNIFVIGLDKLLDHNIISELKAISDVCLYHRTLIHINTLILSFEKEMLFCGHYQMIADSYDEVQNILLEKYEKLIQTVSCPNLNDLPDDLKADLVLLYRQRCVIWENCGDSTLNKDERIAYYKKWSDDCLEGIKICETFSADQELYGCLYLNYASSLNRLTADDSTNSEELLNECLLNLDKAIAHLEKGSADRYLAYGYLHKSDCYEQIILLHSQAGSGTDENAYANNVKEMYKYAMMAWGTLQYTTDDIGKSWALRLKAKSEILTANLSKDIKKMKDGLKLFAEAIRFCKLSNHTNGTASCIRDFSLFIELIEESGFTQALSKEIIDAFFAETETFASIIKLLKIDLQEVVEVQNQLEAIFIKLLL